ncbi:hypothetical protein BJX62DRAFT_88371 [Aspergillus germanicus]
MKRSRRVRFFGLFRRRSSGKNLHPSREGKKPLSNNQAFSQASRRLFSLRCRSVKKGAYQRYCNYPSRASAATQTQRLELFRVLLRLPRSRPRYHSWHSTIQTAEDSPLLLRPGYDWGNISLARLTVRHRGDSTGSPRANVRSTVSEGLRHFLRYLLARARRIIINEKRNNPFVVNHGSCAPLKLRM